MATIIYFWLVVFVHPWSGKIVKVLGQVASSSKVIQFWMFRLCRWAFFQISTIVTWLSLIHWFVFSLY